MMHQYVDPSGSLVTNERFTGDPFVSFLYSRTRENARWLYRALTSPRLTRLLALTQFDRPCPRPAAMRRQWERSMGLNFAECADDPGTLVTPRQVFERKIRYWDCRPMEDDPAAVVSPADARTLLGSFREDSALFVKDKFFDCRELLGADKPAWLSAFADGAFALFRLTPDRYHYTHTPVAGEVCDLYGIEGRYQSCHPAVVVAQATPYSKNRRRVTILDTDRPGGTGVGRVAMIEVVALMIGDIAPRYSRERYENPIPLQVGMTVARGCPLSLFRPGSSTVILLFEKERVRFENGLILNQMLSDTESIFSRTWNRPMTETDVMVRSTIARAGIAKGATS
jgi:phosphatidylserine decarboxylase